MHHRLRKDFRYPDHARHVDSKADARIHDVEANEGVRQGCCNLLYLFRIFMDIIIMREYRKDVKLGYVIIKLLTYAGDVSK